MKIGDIMSQEVISVTSDTAVEDAAGLMLQHHISGLPVIDDHKLTGILTEGDLLRRTEIGTDRQRSRWLELLTGTGKLAREYVRSHGRKVREIMTPEVATVTEDADVEEAVEVMERRRIKLLPVLREGRVVGIIGRRNFLQALVATPPGVRAQAEDKAIRDKLWNELRQRRWKPLDTNIVVVNGIVDIWGIITDEQHRAAICVAAENIPGVKGVRDHLIWVSPYGGVVLDGPISPPDLAV